MLITVPVDSTCFYFAEILSKSPAPCTEQVLKSRCYTLETQLELTCAERDNLQEANELLQRRLKSEKATAGMCNG